MPSGTHTRSPLTLLALAVVVCVAVALIARASRPKPPGEELAVPPGCEGLTVEECRATQGVQGMPESLDPEPSILRADEVCVDVGYLCAEVQTEGNLRLLRWPEGDGSGSDLGAGTRGTSPGPGQGVPAGRGPGNSGMERPPPSSLHPDPVQRRDLRRDGGMVAYRGRGPPGPRPGGMETGGGAGGLQGSGVHPRHPSARSRGEGADTRGSRVGGGSRNGARPGTSPQRRSPGRDVPHQHRHPPHLPGLPHHGSGLFPPQRSRDSAIRALGGSRLIPPGPGRTARSSCRGSTGAYPRFLAVSDTFQSFSRSF